MSWNLFLMFRLPIINIPEMVQIIVWRHPGDKPLYEPMLVSLLSNICDVPLGLNELTL